MSDTQDWMAAYHDRQKALAESNAVNKTAVFDALARANITSVSVNFNGEGDSGQIEEVTAYSNGGPCPIPEIEMDLDGVKDSLTGAIEQLCYDFLSQEHGGWENNDGAFGDFTFDVAKRQIDLDFNSRFSDFTTSSHTF